MVEWVGYRIMILNCELGYNSGRYPKLLWLSVRRGLMFQNVISDLNDTLMDFRSKYGEGRAIAAPQIGVMKQVDPQSFALRGQRGLLS
jgi:hypothetical protein